MAIAITTLIRERVFYFQIMEASNKIDDNYGALESKHISDQMFQEIKDEL